VEYIEKFPYVIKQNKDNKNIVSDALSRRHTLFVTLETKYLGFGHIKKLYQNDNDFSQVFQECSKGSCKEFSIHDNFHFKDKNLWIFKEASH